jgi:hypothetical protein
MVGDQAQRHVQDGSDQPQAAEDQAEQLGFTVAADFDDRAVGKHHPHRDDRLGEHAGVHVAPVRVHAHRAADGDRRRVGAAAARQPACGRRSRTWV